MINLPKLLIFILGRALILPLKNAFIFSIEENCNSASIFCCPKYSPSLTVHSPSSMIKWIASLSCALAIAETWYTALTPSNFFFSSGTSLAMVFSSGKAPVINTLLV